MPFLPALDRRSLLLHVLAVLAYLAMLVHGPLNEARRTSACIRRFFPAVSARCSCSDAPRRVQPGLQPPVCSA